MRNFQQRRRFRNIIYSKPVLVLLSILVFVFAFGVVSFSNKMQLTIENKKIAENKVTELEKEKEKLSSDITKLKTNSGVEESIREKFGLVKEGEDMVIIVEDKNKAEVIDTSSGGFFSFFKNLFK